MMNNLSYPDCRLKYVYPKPISNRRECWNISCYRQAVINVRIDVIDIKELKIRDQGRRRGKSWKTWQSYAVSIILKGRWFLFNLSPIVLHR